MSTSKLSEITRFFHLDLKGAPPKPTYLKNLYSVFKNIGIQGIILEWEDCFPFTGPFDFVSNGRYSTEDALQILEDMKTADLEVIPLLQTFGHLEFVLKHRNLVSYREVPLYPSSLCPSHPDSLRLITALIDQVMSIHPNTKRFHIGADEVWHLGLCALCKARLDAGETKSDLFLRHLKAILRYMNSKWPHIGLLMWDDMLRDVDEAVIKAYDLHSLVEPMVWHYNSTPFTLPPNIWSKYECFRGLWLAGSFKGSSGGSQLVPPDHHHASNTMQWIRTMSLVKTQCKGFVLTGWSRYDHFAALCETLPSSIPSLVLCCKILTDENFTNDSVTEVQSQLKLPLLSTLVRSSDELDRTLFNTWQVVIHATKLAELRAAANRILNCDELQTWMNEYQILHDRVNPMQIISLIPTLTNLVEGFDSLEKNCRLHMETILFEDSINEWIHTYITTIRARLANILHSAEAIVAKATKFVEDSAKQSEMDI